MEPAATSPNSRRAGVHACNRTSKLAEGRVLGHESECGYVHRHKTGEGGGEGEGDGGGGIREEDTRGTVRVIGLGGG
jgi:hypothetical protein